jgi:hypothetical protein
MKNAREGYKRQCNMMTMMMNRWMKPNPKKFQVPRRKKRSQDDARTNNAISIICEYKCENDASKKRNKNEGGKLE